VNAHQIGQAFEAQAVAELLSLGWSILNRNYKGADGEIDIIAFKNGILWFVEVKGSRRQHSRPERSITPLKQRRISRAASVWLAGTDIEPEEISFVACAITPMGIRWITDAFDAQGEA